MVDVYTARMHRVHVDVFPREATPFESGGKTLQSWAGPTIFQRSADNWTETHTYHDDPAFTTEANLFRPNVSQPAPIEHLIYTDETDTVRYLVSLGQHIQKENQILDDLDYADQTPQTATVFDDIIPGFLDATDEVQLYSIQPEDETTREETIAVSHPGPGTRTRTLEITNTELEEASPGETITALAERADQTGARWAVQALGWSTNLELRVAVWNPDGSPLSTAQVKPFKHAFQLGDSHLDFRASREPGLYTPFKAAYDAMSFPVPFAFLPGSLYPPGRYQALTAGLDGVQSALGNAPRNAIDTLATSEKVIGWELEAYQVDGITQDHSHDSLRNLTVPFDPMAIYRVFNKDIVRQLSNLATHYSVQRAAPAIVIATDSSVINAARRVHENFYQDKEGETVDDHVEYVDFVALQEFLQDTSVKGLKPYLQHWLQNGQETTYLFDLSGLHSPSIAAANLLSMMSDAAADLPEPENSHGTWAHILMATPNLVRPGNPALDNVHTALQHTDKNNLLIELLDRRTGPLNKPVVVQTGQAADLTLLGPQLNNEFSVGDFRDAATINGSASASITDWLWTDSPHSSDTVLHQNYWWYGIFDHPGHGSHAFGMPFIARMPGGWAKKIMDTSGSKRQHDAVLTQVTTLELPEKLPDSRSRDSSALSQTHSVGQAVIGHVPRETGLPATVEYNSRNHYYTCVVCERESTSVADARYDVTNDGLARAIQCHGSFGDVKREHIRQLPRYTTKLDAAELDEIAISEPQYQLLRALNGVLRGTIDHRFEYDPLVDSAVKLRDDYGLDQTDITALADLGYITVDSSPHTIYNLTERGRQAIGERKHLGRDVGAGKAELSETIWHRTGRRAAKLALQEEYSDNDGFSVEMIAPIDTEYENTKDTLDVAVRARDGRIVVGVEVERSNNDDRESYARSYEKFAEADPETAIWVVQDHKAGYQLTNYLTEAAARNEIDYSGGSWEYAENKRLQHISIDDEYVTEVKTMQQLVRNVDPPWIAQFE